MLSNLRHPCDEAVIQSQPDVPDCGPATGRWVLAAAILGSSISFIDGTVVNVALPVLQRELDASITGTQWIVESYALMLAALILVGGSLGDRLGRKRVFSAGVLLFALASGWCGLAPDITQLIIARGVQGVGAALLVPGSLALISANFGKENRGEAIGTWSRFTAIAAGIGPVLGGWLVEEFSWRWIFFINLPLAAAYQRLIEFIDEELVEEFEVSFEADELDVLAEDLEETELEEEDLEELDFEEDELEEFEEEFDEEEAEWGFEEEDEEEENFMVR